MIQVTLTFKTLDAALRGLREIPESCLAIDVTEAADPKPQEPKAKAPRAKAAPTAPVEEAAPFQPTAPVTVAPPPAAAPVKLEPAAPAFDYGVLQKKAFELLPRLGKAQILAIAEKHGAATFKELPADKWAAAHADLVALED